MKRSGGRGRGLTTPASRRTFLQCAGCGALGLGASLASPPAAAEPRAAATPSAVAPPLYPGRVVEVFGPDVLVDGQPRQDEVGRMLERGMIELTGARTLSEAWARFVTPQDVVGIKVNALSGPACSTRREVVHAIVQGLALAGVPERNVIVWDRFESHLRRVRFAVQQRPGGLRCYATDSPGVGSDLNVYYRADVLQWVPDALRAEIEEGLAPTYPDSHFSTVFTQHITKQINVPVLKDHNITGMTLCLKNVAFGICGNTERFHPSPINCDPMIGEVCAHPMVREKNVLNIADCLSVLYEGGPTVDPQYLVGYRSLLVGTDMVAMDQVGLQILETLRGEKGLPSLWKTSSPPKYMTTAARLGVGVGSPEAIGHVKVALTEKSR